MTEHRGIEVAIDVESRRGRPTPRRERSFRIAVIGPFGGSRDHARDLDDRHLRPLDRDCLDDVVVALGPCLRFPWLPGTQPLTLERLDDFHPDRVVRRLEPLRTLSELRERLVDPTTSAAATHDLRSEIALPVDHRPPTSEPHDGSRELVRELLEARERPGAPGSLDVDAFTAEVVRRHVTPPAHAGVDRLLHALDDRLSSAVRRVLHDPDFQSLEATWRGADLLVRRLDTGPGTGIDIEILDLSKDELVAAAGDPDDVESSRLFRWLVEPSVGTPGGRPWVLWIGDYTFDASPGDAAALTAIGRSAKAAGTPFVAAASPRALGCESLADTPDPDSWRSPYDPDSARAWAALRRDPSARWIGLALPRFLLRLPYGARTDPIESFPFEETPGVPMHGDYLWGNPAFALAVLLGTGFAMGGPGFDPARYRDLEDLPVHVYRREGQAVSTSPTEAWLTDRAIRAALDRGLMPLAAIRGTTSARLAAFVSLADPPSRLGGFGAIRGQ